MKSRLERFSRGRRRQRLLAALALVFVVGVVVAVVTSAGPPSPTQATSNSGGSSGAATVQRRDLVQTDTEAGTLSYSNPQTVYNRLGGTITWLPSVGQTIRPGGTLYRVDGEPVLLMNGSTPAYRPLSAADPYGADVLQLNRNLVRLGFNADGITVNDEWQAGTTLGVELLQDSLGESPTGILSLGQIVFLPGDQLVSTVEVTLGAGSGAGSANASTPVDGNAPEFVSLKTNPPPCPPTTTPATTTTTTATATTTSTSASTTATTPTPSCPTPAPPPPKTKPNPMRHRDHRGEGDRQTLAALTALLKAEEAQLRADAAQLRADGNSPSGGGHGGRAGAGSGGGSGAGSSGSGGSGSGGSGGSGTGGSGQAILETTSIHLIVTVDLDASSQSEAVVGEHVTVELPASNTVNGRITEVSPVAQNSSGSGNGNGSGGGSGNAGGNGAGGGNGGGGNGGGSSSTIPVTITLSGHHTGAGLDQAAVSVNFAQQRANHVLSVPVTALLATGGGKYAVQEASAPSRLIPVTPGLFAAGYVQISGPGITPGLRVTDSQG